jgi:hypothetical protein
MLNLKNINSFFLRKKISLKKLMIRRNMQPNALTRRGYRTQVKCMLKTLENIHV